MSSSSSSESSSAHEEEVQKKVEAPKEEPKAEPKEETKKEKKSKKSEDKKEQQEPEKSNGKSDKKSKKEKKDNSESKTQIVVDAEKKAYDDDDKRASRITIEQAPPVDLSSLKEKAGYIEKKGTITHTWSKFYCVVGEGKIQFWPDAKSWKDKKTPKSVVDLEGCNVFPVVEKKGTSMPTYLNVRTLKKDILLRAISEDDKNQFVASIRNNLTEAKSPEANATRKSALNRRPTVRNSFLGVVKSTSNGNVEIQSASSNEDKTPEAKAATTVSEEEPSEKKEKKEKKSKKEKSHEEPKEEPKKEPQTEKKEEPEPQPEKKEEPESTADTDGTEKKKKKKKKKKEASADDD